MWRIVEAERKIRDGQKKLETLLIEASTNRLDTRVGYQGGGGDVQAYWVEPLHIWFSPERAVDAPLRYYWNAFGIEKPSLSGSGDIICELNFPRSGIHRQVGAAFAVDEDGNLHIVHRGNIGGGRTGVGKKAFFEHYRGKRVLVQDGTVGTKVALVGDLSSRRLLEHIAEFVHEVERVKDAVVHGLQVRKAIGQLPKFSDEPEARRGYEALGWRQPSADHGLVVNYLAGKFEAAGHTVGNDRHRDLFVLGRSENVKILFEVKTSITDIYEAVGQLFVYSAHEKVHPALVLVAPRLPKSLVEAIKKLRVYVLPYEFDGKQPRIPGLKTLFHHLSVSSGKPSMLS